MTAHTPGPWVVTGEIDRFHGGEWIRPLDSKGHQKSELVAVVCDFNRYDRDAERQANAQLIAAAPDLLVFADWMATIADGFYSRHTEIGRKRLLAEIRRAALDVIAKATGGQP
jgi:hypothetical protein